MKVLGKKRALENEAQQLESEARQTLEEIDPHDGKVWVVIDLLLRVAIHLLKRQQKPTEP